tara:strand:- start:825 stop:1124 length:300 start_codon:yes stop_codon:yes gene_type:complete
LVGAYVSPSAVGLVDGEVVGAALGLEDEGAPVGNEVVGDVVGEAEGELGDQVVPFAVGPRVGIAVGRFVGTSVGEGLIAYVARGMHLVPSLVRLIAPLW